MGVYGGFLEFFGELIEWQEFYRQEPLENGGYKNRESIETFPVIFQDDGFQSLAKSESQKALDIKDGVMLWSVENIPIGVFFDNPHENNGVYRIVKRLNYDREGGFYIYAAEKVTGASGSQTEKLSLKHGAF